MCYKPLRVSARTVLEKFLHSNIKCPAQAVHRNKIIVRVMRFGQIIYHPIGKTLNRMSQQKRNLEHVPIKSYDQITGQNK